MGQHVRMSGCQDVRMSGCQDVRMSSLGFAVQGRGCMISSVRIRV